MGEKKKTDFVLTPAVKQIVENRVRRLRKEVFNLDHSDSPEEVQKLHQDIEDFVIEAEYRIGQFQQRIVELGGRLFDDYYEDDDD
jgi:hypothetical protein